MQNEFKTYLNSLNAPIFYKLDQVTDMEVQNMSLKHVGVQKCACATP